MNQQQPTFKVSIDLTLSEILGIVAARLTIAGFPYLNQHNPPSLIVPLIETRSKGSILTCLGTLSDIVRIQFFSHDDLDPLIQPSLKGVFGGEEYAELSIDPMSNEEMRHSLILKPVRFSIGDD